MGWEGHPGEQQLRAERKKRAGRGGSAPLPPPREQLWPRLTDVQGSGGRTTPGAVRDERVRQHGSDPRTRWRELLQLWSRWERGLFYHRFVFFLFSLFLHLVALFVLSFNCLHEIAITLTTLRSLSCKWKPFDLFICDFFLLSR